MKTGCMKMLLAAAVIGGTAVLFSGLAQAQSSNPCAAAPRGCVGEFANQDKPTDQRFTSERHTQFPDRPMAGLPGTAQVIPVVPSVAAFRDYEHGNVYPHGNNPPSQ